LAFALNICICHWHPPANEVAIFVNSLRHVAGGAIIQGKKWPDGHRVSRATVCRLVNESGRLEKTGVPHVGNQEKVISLAEASNSQIAA
jgi:hypothetical protein